MSNEGHEHSALLQEDAAHISEVEDTKIALDIAPP